MGKKEQVPARAIFVQGSLQPLPRRVQLKSTRGSPYGRAPAETRAKHRHSFRNALACVSDTARRLPAHCETDNPNLSLFLARAVCASSGPQTAAAPSRCYWETSNGPRARFAPGVLARAKPQPPGVWGQTWARFVQNRCGRYPGPAAGCICAFDGPLCIKNK